jgi:excisionase family DNA binding protein
MTRQNTVAKVGKRVVSFGAQGQEEPVDRLLTVGEAAELLSCSKSSLNKWRITGNGPRFVYIGNRVRYRASELINFINRHTRVSTSEVSAA